jgi:hypothetical protein
MKKKPDSKTETLPHYDFSKGVRGTHAKRYAKGANVVVLDPDVARAFPNGKVVNRHLRKLAKSLAL